MHTPARAGGTLSLLLRRVHPATTSRATLPAAAAAGRDPREHSIEALKALDSPRRLLALAVYEVLFRVVRHHQEVHRHYPSIAIVVAIVVVVVVVVAVIIVVVVVIIVVVVLVITTAGTTAITID